MSSTPGDYYGQGDAVPPPQQQDAPPFDPYGPTGTFDQPPPGYGYNQPQAQQGYGAAPGYGYGGYGQQPMPPGYYGPPMVQPRTNGMAVTGMIMGILSILLFWASVFGLIICILAVVFSGIGMSQCTKRGEAGRGMAITGLVCGIIALAIWVVVAVVIASFVSGLALS